MHFNQFRAILINSRSLSINPRSLSINSGHFKSIQEHFSSIRMHFIDSNEFYPPKIHFIHILIGSEGHFLAFFNAFYPIFDYFSNFSTLFALLWQFQCFRGQFDHFLEHFSIVLGVLFPIIWVLFKLFDTFREVRLLLQIMHFIQFYPILCILCNLNHFQRILN